MFRVVADNSNYALAPYNLAFLASNFHAGTHFHLETTLFVPVGYTAPVQIIRR